MLWRIEKTVKKKGQVLSPISSNTGSIKMIICVNF